MHTTSIMVHGAERSRTGAQERVPVFLAGDRPMLTQRCLQSRIAMCPAGHGEHSAVMWSVGRSLSEIYATQSTLADQVMHI